MTHYHSQECTFFLQHTHTHTQIHRLQSLIKNLQELISWPLEWILTQICIGIEMMWSGMILYTELEFWDCKRSQSLISNCKLITTKSYHQELLVLWSPRSLSWGPSSLLASEVCFRSYVLVRLGNVKWDERRDYTFIIIIIIKFTTSEDGWWWTKRVECALLWDC